MTSILEAERKIYSVDAPTKAPVNEEGKSVGNNQLVLVFPDDGYKQIEESYKKKQLETEIVEGESKEL
jgi:hypothetical protein